MNNTKYYCVCKKSFRKKHYFINHKNNCEVFKLHEQNEIQKTLFKKNNKIALMFTGQLRTFNKCWKNVYNNLISCNKDYIFDIYFLIGKNEYSKKHNYHENTDNIENEIKNIIKINKNILNIKIFILDISYPSYFLCNNDSWKVLYKNKLLFEKVIQLDKNYDIYIRMRSDIIFTNNLNLNNLDFNFNIHIITSVGTIKCFNHNRDWDYMAISNFKGMELWCKCVNFLENPINKFPQCIKFNNKSNWVYKTDDIGVSAWQSLFGLIKKNNYNLIYDSGKCYVEILRF